LSAYKDVAHDVIATVTKELDRFPGHRIVVTGAYIPPYLQYTRNLLLTRVMMIIPQVTA
jgi:hypothetical protein